MMKILQVVTNLKSEMKQMKVEMEDQHQNQISRLEKLHEKEKSTIEELYKDEINGYKAELAQEKNENGRLKINLQKQNTKIQSLEKVILEKDKKINEFGIDLNTLKTEKDDLQSDLQT